MNRLIVVFIALALLSVCIAAEGDLASDAAHSAVSSGDSSQISSEPASAPTQISSGGSSSIYSPSASIRDVMAKKKDLFVPRASAVSCVIAPQGSLIPLNGFQVRDYSQLALQANCFDSNGAPATCPILTWGVDNLPGSRVSPSQPSAYTTLYSGAAANGSVHAAVTVVLINSTQKAFSCSAHVSVYHLALPAAYCTVLTVDGAQALEIETNGNATLGVDCFDADGYSLVCPVLTWKNNVAGGRVTPAQSRNYTTFYAGAFPANGTVTASVTMAPVPNPGSISASPWRVFQCGIAVHVYETQTPAMLGCTLAPQDALVPVNSVQQFNASCYYTTNGSQANCPLLEWSTTAPSSSMLPTVSNASSTLHTGFRAGYGVVYANGAAEGALFSCQSAVAVYTNETALSCTLGPQNASVPFNGSLDYYSSCYDANGAQANCPVLAWSTTAPGASMNPTASNDSSEFTAGFVAGNWSVDADYSVLHCAAAVEVYSNATHPEANTLACTLAPQDALVPVNNVQQFNASCYYAANGTAADCPALNWATDVAGASVNPLASNESTLFYAGNTADAGTVTAVGASQIESFACNADVLVYDFKTAVSCALNPQSASVAIGASQAFNASCFTINGTQANCPVLAWSTDIAGAGVNPLASNDTALFTAGNTAGAGHVFADAVFSCNATVVVYNPASPASCALSPASASLQAGATQAFTAYCYDSASATVDCGNLSWSTTVPGASVSPLLGNASVFQAGGFATNGLVYAAEIGVFYCSVPVDVYVTGGGSSSGDIYSPGSGGSGGGTPTVQPTIEPSVQPTNPPAEATPTPEPSAEPTPEASPEPSPEAVSPLTGLFSAFTGGAGLALLLLILACVALFIASEYYGWKP